MPNSFIETVKERIVTLGMTRNTRESRQWLWRNMRKVDKVRGQTIAAQLRRDPKTKRGLPLPGRVYLFRYTPKYKATLPYYDAFPLTIVVKRYRNGFLGLNLHYLPPKLRIVLFDHLIRLNLNNRDYDEKTRFKLTWRYLKHFSKRRFIKPIVKRYLYDHLDTKFIEVPPNEWEITVFLPLETFKKEQLREVWKNSEYVVKNIPKRPLRNR